MDSSVDPRPLLGEPLALDLLNTEWVEDGRPRDLLSSPDGVRTWLHSNGLLADKPEAAATWLIEARAAIRGVLAHRDPESGARGRLNAVLEHGRVRVLLDGEGQPERRVEADEASWLPGVLCAYNLVELLERFPGRIRRCAHPSCVLWFLDTSRNGTRRWCSMAGCGNRAKAQRHYDRTRGSRDS